MLSDLGYKVKPYHDACLPNFSRHTDSQKAEIIRGIRAYCEALQDVCKFDDNIDMGQFVWRFLLRLGIAPSQDLFTTLENEKFIQIYNPDQFQIFRSLRCFERCSFTLEELTSRSWYELWERDSLFFYALTGLATKLIQFMKPGLLRLDFPYHTVREVESECLFDFRYKIKSVSVLTRHKRAQAAVLIEDWKF
ncbi:MAG: hypothetical protein JSU04_14930 [Bdellovibrionales bacterium]|nr:hypothetical protein [Bdellovibrionales bacterium]